MGRICHGCQRPLALRRVGDGLGRWFGVVRACAHCALPTDVYGVPRAARTEVEDAVVLRLDRFDLVSMSTLFAIPTLLFLLQLVAFQWATGAMPQPELVTPMMLPPLFVLLVLQQSWSRAPSLRRESLTLRANRLHIGHRTIHYAHLRSIERQGPTLRLHTDDGVQLVASVPDEAEAELRATHAAFLADRGATEDSAMEQEALGALTRERERI